MASEIKMFTDEELGLDKLRNARTLGAEFKKRVKRNPNKEFLIDWITGKGERRLTYKQEAENVYRLCWATKDLGIKKGDFVAIIGYNTMEHIDVIYASSLIGFVYGCQNPDLPDDWLVTIVNDRMGAKVVFFEDSYREKIKRLMARFKTTRHYICLNGPAEENIMSYHDWVSKYEPKEVELEINPDELHCLYMSGGTTGMPKAAMWTHEGAWWYAFYVGVGYEAGPETVGIQTAPFFISTAIAVGVHCAVIRGGSIVMLSGKFSPAEIERFCEAITKEKANWALSAGYAALEIASWPDEKWKKYDLSSLQNSPWWGATVPYSVYKTLYDRWGITGWKIWGSCEFGGGLFATHHCITRLVEKGEEKRAAAWGNVDCALAELRIIDAERNDVPPGEVGELILRTPACFRGYLGEPERSARKITKDGWIMTGDMMSIDDGGWLYMEGKKEDLGMVPVDMEGRFVMPYRAIDAVVNLPEIVEASAIAYPDPEYKAKLVIVARPKQGVEVGKEKIIEAASKEMPHYLIKDVVIRKEPIPRTPLGKTSVRELAKELGGVIPEAE